MTKFDREPLRAALARIRRENVELQAFLHIIDDEAADLAEESGRTAKPLSGLLIGVKDLIDTADMPTSYGSAVYSNHRPMMDAAIVAGLKDAGAIIVGKTTTTEFATWPPTPTVNPHNHGHTPGGSSAGSAAAVGAGLVHAALGSQTLGSVIRPASFCGVVGFKPTYGRISRSGVKAVAESLDTLGFFTRTVADAERMYAALVADNDVPDTAEPRFAFCRSPHWDLVSKDAQQAIENGIAHLRAKGISVTDLELPGSFSEVSPNARVVHDYEMSRSLLPELKLAREKINPSLAAGIESASRWTGEDHASALKVLETHRPRLSRLIAPHDAVLCPAALGEAPAGLANTGDPAMSILWTALHVPCITLPVLKGATGMPVGMQLIADRYEDRKLLKAATVVEKAFAF